MPVERNNKIKRSSHRTYLQASKRLEQKQAEIGKPLQPKRRGGSYWWVGGRMWNTKGELVEACVGPFSSAQEAEQTAYEKFDGTPDVFESRHSTSTEANREYRMRRAGRLPSFGDTFERVRHQGEDLGFEE